MQKFQQSAGECCVFRLFSAFGTVLKFLPIAAGAFLCHNLPEDKNTPEKGRFKCSGP